MSSVVFRNVWQKSDARAEQDASKAWSVAGVLGGLDPQERAKELCVVVYDGDELVALTTAYTAYLPMVREVMAFYRVFVVPTYRQRRVAIQLAYATHEAMSEFAQARPQLRIGGTAIIVSVRGFIDKPARDELTLIGYSKNDEPILVRWFDHFMLDEDAARARRGP
jgi:hypothetical protein